MIILALEPSFHGLWNVLDIGQIYQLCKIRTRQFANGDLQVDGWPGENLSGSPTAMFRAAQECDSYRVYVIEDAIAILST